MISTLKNVSTRIALDENGLLFLKAEPEDDRHVKFSVEADVPVRPAMIDNLMRQLAIRQDAQRAPLPNASVEWPSSNQLGIRMGAIDIAQIERKEDMLQADWLAPRRLSVFETRMMGRSAQSTFVPEHLDAPPYKPLTDLHTHQSGQVRGGDLTELGLKHNILYPTRALEIAGVNYAGLKTEKIQKHVFLPLAHLDDGSQKQEDAVRMLDLPPQELKRLEYALSLPFDRQSTFEVIETCYWLREPFTKNLQLLPEILEKIALDYQKQGIRYAELSSNAVLDPTWLRVIHEVMPGIEKSTGVQLRFLAGLPRNLDDGALSKRIEQIKKVAMASPYVVGVDVLGFEMNKTSHMNTHLDSLAGWMSQHRADLVLRIHAGENSKNPENVREAIELAEKYNVRIRIGHAIHGLEDDVLRLVQTMPLGNVMVEFNPDSNMAGNNIDHPAEVPLAVCLDKKIPYVLGSDGASIYLTNAHQTGAAAALCGLRPEHAQAIRSTEEEYIRQQQHHFFRNSIMCTQENLDALQPMEKSPPVPKPNGVHPQARQQVEALMEQKHPLFIAGAGGRSYAALDESARRNIEDGFNDLLSKLNPDKVCFVTGRTKDESIGSVLGARIAAYNRANSKKFEMVQVLAESEPTLHAAGTSHTLRLDVPLVFLPGALIPMIKQHKGMGLFLGGRQFTRDFITESDARELAFGVMSDALGASSSKARIYPESGFVGSGGMVECMRRNLPDIFKDDVFQTAG